MVTYGSKRVKTFSIRLAFEWSVIKKKNNHVIYSSAYHTIGTHLLSNFYLTKITFFQQLPELAFEIIKVAGKDRKLGMKVSLAI